jgi:hypothetical protein
MSRPNIHFQEISQLDGEMNADETQEEDRKRFLACFAQTCFSKLPVFRVIPQ